MQALCLETRLISMENREELEEVQRCMKAENYEDVFILSRHDCELKPVK